MLKKILIVEDNKELIEYLKEFFKLKGEFNVEGLSTGVEALKLLKKEKPDLIIIDLQLADIKGETICMEARKTYNDLPIIILTGDKSPSSIISCLNSGADDYVTKPFNAEELLARVNARLRSVNTNSNAAILSVKDLSINLDTLEVTKGDKKIEFTSKEFELLKYLIINKKRICTRDKIIYSVWGYNSEVETRVVDVHIGKLRKKLETDTEKYIESVRSYGYRILLD